MNKTDSGCSETLSNTPTNLLLIDEDISIMNKNRDHIEANDEQNGPIISDSPIVLTQAEFYILFDTAINSLRIADNGSIFRFDTKTRERLINNLLERMGQVRTEIR